MRILKQHFPTSDPLLISFYNQLDITVVIPTAYRSGLLKRCIESLKKQRWLPPSFEVIVVIDGPDTESIRCVQSCMQSGFPVRFILHTSSKGPAAARNTGWKNAGGSWIIFTDDDCIARPDFIFRYADAFYHCGYRAAFSGSISVPIPPKPTDYQKNTAGLEQSGFITANCACSKEVLQRTGGFDEQYHMAWREDTDLFFALLKLNIPVWRVAEAAIIHPVRKAGWGVSIREQKKSLYNALLYKKYPKLFREYVMRQPVWLYYGIICSFLTALASFLAGLIYMGIAFGLAWAILTITFIGRRLHRTTKVSSHVGEMVITSVIIPFLSIYWTLYGSLKYKVFFL